MSSIYKKLILNQEIWQLSSNKLIIDSTGLYIVAVFICSYCNVIIFVLSWLTWLNTSMAAIIQGCHAMIDLKQISLTSTLTNSYLSWTHLKTTLRD